LVDDGLPKKKKTYRSVRGGTKVKDVVNRAKRLEGKIFSRKETTNIVVDGEQILKIGDREWEVVIGRSK
jgi:hypothetical protein